VSSKGNLWRFCGNHRAASASRGPCPHPQGVSTTCLLTHRPGVTWQEHRRDTRASPQPGHCGSGSALPGPSSSTGPLALEEPVEGYRGGSAVAAAGGSETLFKNIPTGVLQAEFIARLMRQGPGAAGTEQEPAEQQQQQQQPRGTDEHPAVPLHEQSTAGARQAQHENTTGASLPPSLPPATSGHTQSPRPASVTSTRRNMGRQQGTRKLPPQAPAAEHYEKVREPRAQGRLSLPSPAPRGESRHICVPRMRFCLPTSRALALTPVT